MEHDVIFNPRFKDVDRIEKSLVGLKTEVEHAQSKQCLGTAPPGYPTLPPYLLAATAAPGVAIDHSFGNSRR